MWEFSTKTAFVHLKNISTLIIYHLSQINLQSCLHKSRLSGVSNEAPDASDVNSVARPHTHAKPKQRMNPNLIKLHWSSVKSRISYQLLPLMLLLCVIFQSASRCTPCCKLSSISELSERNLSRSWPWPCGTHYADVCKASFNRHLKQHLLKSADNLSCF